MARGTIFITGNEERRVLKEDYWYSYLEENGEGILRVYKQHELVFEKKAHIEDAFEVILRGNKVLITEMTPPRNKGDVIGWLLGFSRHERVSSCEEYRDFVIERWLTIPTIGCVEYTTAAVRFEFTKYALLDEANGRIHNLACWVDDNITKQEIFHLIPQFVYPEFYIKKVLSEIFGISSEEVEKALSFSS